MRTEDSPQAPPGARSGPRIAPDVSPATNAETARPDPTVARTGTVRAERCEALGAG